MADTGSMIEKDSLLELYPEFHTVYGPYTRSDGRKHVILQGVDIKKTISFPKALVEVNIGRTLLPNETVDHQDRNKTNNLISNLVVRDRSEHASIDAIRVHVAELPCPICGTMFTPTLNQRNHCKDKAGPFCSRSCAGKYGAAVQNGAETIPRQNIVRTYYKKEKD